MGISRRARGWVAAAAGVAVLGVGVSVTVPATAGVSIASRPARPTPASLQKQVLALRAQQAKLCQRVGLVAKTPGPQGLPGPPGIQGVPGPVGARVIRATVTLPDNSPLTTLATLPGLGRITAACADGYHHQVRATAVVTGGSRTTGTGFGYVAMPWQRTAQLTGTSAPRRRRLSCSPR